MNDKNDTHPTRTYLIDVALRLFAEKGFASTSVADITGAAGMSPTAGGMYRHFGSKSELMEAAVESVVASGRPVTDLADARETAQSIAAVLAELRRDRQLLRVTLRGGLDAFPQLTERILEDQIKPTIQTLADSLDGSDTSEEEALHTAAIAMCAIVGYEVLDVLFGQQLGGLDDDVFVLGLAALTGCAGDEESGSSEPA